MSTTVLSREDASTYADELAQLYLGNIVNRHVAERIGNGSIPTPDWTKTVTMLYECGRPIPDIVNALSAVGIEITIRQAMECLGLDYLCGDCGRGADLGIGVASSGADGDRDYDFLGTACCQHHFISRGGCVYMGENPAWEGTW